MKVSYIKLNPMQRHLALVLLSQNYKIASTSNVAPRYLDQLANMYNRLHEIPPTKHLLSGDIYEWTLIEPHNVLMKEINVARNRWLNEHKDVQGINEILCKLVKPHQRNRSEELCL